MLHPFSFASNVTMRPSLLLHVIPALALLVCQYVSSGIVFKRSSRSSYGGCGGRTGGWSLSVCVQKFYVPFV